MHGLANFAKKPRVMSEQNKKWRDCFFDQMRAATRAPGSAKRDHERAFYSTVDKIVIDKAIDEAFPRHASKSTDDRIQRLVSGLEESAEIKKLFAAEEEAAAADEDDAATISMHEDEHEERDTVPPQLVAQKAR